MIFFFKMPGFRNVVEPCVGGKPDGIFSSPNTMYTNKVNSCLFPGHVSAINSLDWKSSAAQ